MKSNGQYEGRYELKQHSMGATCINSGGYMNLFSPVNSVEDIVIQRAPLTSPTVIIGVMSQGSNGIFYAVAITYQMHNRFP